MSATTMTAERPLGIEVPRGIGLPGRVVISWSTAGGVLLGGILVAAMTLTGQLSGSGLFFTASGLFVIGAVLGMIHGAVLGFLGRDPATSGRDAASALARSALYAIPAIALGWLATIWIAMTVVAIYMGRSLGLLGVGIAWGAGVALVAAAVVYGWRAIRNAYGRWPERRTGTVVVAMTFAALLVTFLADRPELWGIRFRVTEVGAVLLAAALSIWIAGPAVTMALRLLGRLPAPHPNPTFVRPASTWKDTVTGLLVGLGLGILAVPVAGPSLATATGTMGAVVTSVSEAVVNEVLLRLVLLTSVAWVLLRWQRVRPVEAVTAAVVITALIQVVLYAPGVMALGFPGPLGATAFVLVTVLLPGLAFGTLYWLRGFGTALVADATAVTAMALMLL